MKNYNNSYYTGPDPKMTEHEYKKLLTLHNKFKDKRIFIMGNGPSLNKMDLELLKEEYVFCVNRIQLLLKKVSWKPSFYTAFDLTVVPDNLDEFNALDVPVKFFATKHKGAIEEKDNHFWYHDNSRPGGLDNRYEELSSISGFGGGGTVATLAIQLAYFMGFDPIILVGCDASYSIPSTANQKGPDKFNDGVKLFLKSTQNDDKNHFDPTYFGKGKRWHNPNVADMHRGFEKSYRVIKSKSRTIVNATVGGSLECMPRVNYHNLFLPQVQKKIIVGIDLTQPVAEISTGIRNYLIEALSNINLFDVNIQIYLICTEKNINFYKSCESIYIKTIMKNDKKILDVIRMLDCVHYPFNSVSSSLKYHSKSKKIVSMHDLIPLTQPGFPDSIKLTYLDAAKNADAIICLTATMQKIICDRLNFPLENSYVSSPYVGDDFIVEEVERTIDEETLVSLIQKTKNKYKLRFPYVIYPAAFRPHKNHDMLIQAMRYVYTNLHLVLTTGEDHDPAKKDSLINKVKDMNLSHRIHVLGKTSTDDYINLLKGSIALVYPSLDEGFGIPVAEAQSLGVPVLSSRCAALSEVAQGSLAIDPYNHRDIAEKINMINEDIDLRAEIVLSGRNNVKKYTKEICARGLLEGYMSCIQK